MFSSSAVEPRRFSSSSLEKVLRHRWRQADAPSNCFSNFSKQPLALSFNPPEQQVKITTQCSQKASPNISFKTPRTDVWDSSRNGSCPSRQSPIRFTKSQSLFNLFTSSAMILELPFSS